MRLAVLAASSAAALVAALLIDGSPFLGSAQAAKGHGGNRSVARPQSQARTVHRNIQTRTFKKPAMQVHKNFVKQAPGGFKKFVPPAKNAVLVKNSKNFGQFNLKTLPTFKPIASAGFLKGRVGVPLNFKPKLSLIKGPQLHFKPRFAPFLQRNWRRAFFWVAIAGIGYVTVPELYYDRFYSYVSVDDPDYDGALAMLSLAALEEEDEVVRVPMPAGVAYRYTAKAPPTPEVRKACPLETFVDRKWNSSYVYVQVPEVGSVTVPESDYDRFYSFVSAEPPNYTPACAVLTEAAAADTVIAAVQMAPGSQEN